MTPQEFFEQLTKLNIEFSRQQLKAVQAVQGPVLLLAVPGSGKTTVLVSRLGYMIHCCNIPPEKILILTYTVAATKDMTRRYASFFGEDAATEVEFRTINGICAKIIAYYGRLIGKTSFTLLTDEKLLTGILSQIYQKETEAYPTESDLKAVRQLITYIKNSMLTEEEMQELEKEADGIPIVAIYKSYCKVMRENRYMDYDDQMLYAYKMLQKSPQVLLYFQQMYSYICVDEAQDTSKIQHKIIALLASANDNLFMVGDEDQSIYGFRAAFPEALLHFEKDHPGARVLLMEDNFRSNACIVRAADAFIQKNMLRHKKSMRPVKVNGSEIRVIEMKSRSAQYTYLKKVAENCDSRHTTAVLYRDNESIIPLVDLLEYENIPYRIRNAEVSFFTHRIVNDIRAIIRFAYNPFDTESFLQIYYKINLYLKKQDAVRIAKISGERDMPVLDVAVNYGLQPRTVANLKAMRSHLNNMKRDTGSRMINRIVQYMGYSEYLDRAGLDDSKIYILNRIAAGAESPQAFLERLSYLQDTIKNRENDKSCSFILSTIHSSKGLEYDVVYLMDVIDGIFPDTVPEHIQRLKGKELEEYEEERRIFYVGVTRAKEELNIFSAGKSLFIRQLMGEQGSIKNTPEYLNYVNQFGEGIAVIHKSFGAGIVSVLGKDTITIWFGELEREKTFSLPVLYRSRLLQLQE